MSFPYNFLFYLINFLELITAVMALIYFNKYKYSTERYFLHFLWITFFLDTILGTLVAPFLKTDSTWIYYTFTGISFSFYYWWYHTILVKKLHKKLTITFSIIFIIVYTFNILHVEFHQYSFIIGAFFLLILAGFYLHQLFNADDILNLRHKLSFWFTIALVLFNVSMIPFILLSEYFNFWVNDPVFISILFFLNLVLYSCYIAGFIWTKEKYNHS